MAPPHRAVPIAGGCRQQRPRERRRRSPLRLPGVVRPGRGAAEPQGPVEQGGRCGGVRHGGCRGAGAGRGPVHCAALRAAVPAHQLHPGALAGRPEDERRRLLQGTGIPEAVEKDLANIHLEYSSIIVPFMESHPNVFDPKLHTLELYKQLVAFVMAYSFQEPLEEEDEDEKGPNPPVMVPVADILNHVANHNANLEYSPQCLRMVTTQPISKGQEIFNTYGQMANWQLLHMYGFAEPYPSNTNDTADIQMVTVRTAALRRARSEVQQRLVLEQWDFLCQLEMVGEEGAFVLGWDEVLTEEELSVTLKVLCMSEEEFKEYKEQDSGEDDSEEDENLTLSNEALSRLKPPCKQLLYDSVLLTLESYRSDLKAEQDLLHNKEAYEKLSQREQQALHVRYGQKRILHQLLELVH
ncbi:N-lysine methyltransferase SETD6 [Pezoporus wallicus]|uniref:N-lysine methyltransferase SETD6 n=1 Tax=Pezoporus wallicus TaxID=35540 RepID=UPI0025511B6D|nr:N-lysine methyltransferase SETD6 [Pezoporus wallicus]